MDRKKILFFLPLMSGGGAERVTINIIKGLDNRYYETHLVLGTKKFGNSIHLIPKDIYQHDLNSDKSIYSIFKLRKIVKKLNPDFIYSSLNRSHIAINLALTFLKNRPKTIMRIPSSPKLVDKYVKHSRLFSLFLNYALKKSDIIIVQTPEMRDETNIYHHIQRSKIKVLINPLDIDLIENSLEGENPFNSLYINVVASGRLSREKGFDILIKAFRGVYLKNNQFRLHIIGPDYNNQKREYEKLIEDLELVDVVHLLGFKKNPYIYYKHSDLFVLSSRWEGLPNAVLENIYLKKPIVATRCIPFMSQLIKDKRSGFLVDVESITQLTDAILRYRVLDSVGDEVFKNSDINSFFKGL
jgi:glycosyltransferase involved in cell wall biosynthesis